MNNFKLPKLYKILCSREFIFFRGVKGNAFTEIVEVLVANSLFRIDRGVSTSQSDRERVGVATIRESERGFLPVRFTEDQRFVDTIRVTTARPIRV